MNLATPVPGAPDAVAAGPSQPTKPSGLLGRLLDQGILKQDFVAEDSTYTVETRIMLDPQKAWLYRCAVKQDGKEISAPPWQPQLENLTPSMAGKEATQEEETRLAQRALEAHLKRSQELSRWIESRAGSRPTSVPWSLPSIQLPSKRPVIVAVAILLIAVGGWFGYLKFLEQEEMSSGQMAKLEAPMPSAQAAPDPPNDPQAVVADAAFSEESKVAEDSVDAVSEVSELAAPMPPQRETAATPPPPRSSTQDRVATSSRTTPRPSVEAKRKTPASTPTARRSESTTTVAQPNAPEPKPEIQQSPAAAQDPPPPRSVRSVDPFRNWVADIEPRQHRRFTLEPGATPYADDEIRLIEVPSTGLQCITTPSSQGDTDQGIFFKIAEPTKVIVAHHNKVKRTPDWLDDLTPTGRTWQAQDIATGQELLYTVFEKSYPPGAVAFGSNANPRKLTRSVRPWVRNKKVAMYLVCLVRLGDHGATSR